MWHKIGGWFWDDFLSILYYLGILWGEFWWFQTRADLVWFSDHVGVMLDILVLIWVAGFPTIVSWMKMWIKLLTNGDTMGAEHEDLARMGPSYWNLLLLGLSLLNLLVSSCFMSFMYQYFETCWIPICSVIFFRFEPCFCCFESRFFRWSPFQPLKDQVWPPIPIAIRRVVFNTSRHCRQMKHILNREIVKTCSNMFKIHPNEVKHIKPL